MSDKLIYCMIHILCVMKGKSVVHTCYVIGLQNNIRDIGSYDMFEYKPEYTI